MFIYPYSMASASASALGHLLRIRRIKREGSTFKGHEDKVVLNWGCSSLPQEVLKCRVINPPNLVATCANKLRFFDHIHKYNMECAVGEEVRVPRHTVSFETARIWASEGYSIVERHKLTGHSGEGIRISTTEDGVLPAPLYTVYIPKKSEYRVHVCNGEVVDVQRKARNRSVPDSEVNWQVRNHANGFIYQRQEVYTPLSVRYQALKVMEAVGLDFGAVDIVYQEASGKAYVIEVNTAPGLTGTTLEGYVARLAGYSEETPL